MQQNVMLNLSIDEVDFIITVLGAVPTMQTAQAGRLDLIPRIREQAQQSLKQQAELQAKAERIRNELLANERAAGLNVNGEDTPVAMEALRGDAERKRAD